MYDFGFPVRRDDLINITLRNNSGTGNDKVRVVNYYTSAGKLEVVIENNSSAPIQFSLFLTILSIKPSFLG